MSGRSPAAGIFRSFTLHFSCLASSFVDTLERIELKVVLLIEPAALEEFQRQAGPPGQGERIDRELHVGVGFFSRFRLVVEDADVTVADLQEIDMAGNAVAFEI